MNPAELPIRGIEADVLDAFRRGNRLVLQAPTGSGKSTQVPQMLLDSGVCGDGQIVVLQPRRLPTRLLAARVAAERGTRLGDEVGFEMRFERAVSARTRIRFVTEGVLLRQMLDRPTLPGVSVLIFDEFHERHLHTDLGLARARLLAEGARPDLKIAVMSATLDAEEVAAYLDPCTVLRSEGRTFPVEIRHLAKSPGDEPVWDTAASALETIAPTTAGDVLIFMPGSREIYRTLRAIENSKVGREFAALPLHGELSPSDQDAALAPHAKRKAIVSTNVAETSLTIEGVRAVIDSGLARIPRFDPARGINTLLVEKISRASADQRAGRAGRTAPGFCLRLWTGREQEARPARELPEIRRLDLAEAVLSLKASGVDDVRGFPWLESPGEKSLLQALSLLRDLGALSGTDARITDRGRHMLAFPVHPRYSRMFLAAETHGCVRAVALIAALTQGRPLLQRSTGRAMDDLREDVLGGEAFSDFFLLSRAWRFAAGKKFDPGPCRRLGIHAAAARQVGPVFEQFLRVAEAQGLDISERAAAPEAVARCLLSGFSDHVARRLDPGTLRCQMVGNRRGTLARESAVRDHTLFVASEVRELEGADVQVLLSMATAIEPDWLKELFPEDFREEKGTRFDPAAKRVISRVSVLFRDLVLEEGRGAEPPPGEAAAALAREVIEGRCLLEQWDAEVDGWIARLNFLAQHFPDLPPLRDADRATLIEQICYGATSLREIKARPVWPSVRAWLSPAQIAFLEKSAPERVVLPNGRSAKIGYSDDAPPTVAARIQDLFGVADGFSVAGGRVPVLIQVLAPNGRPVQVTQSLATFWRETYPELRPALQRRYPKHEWREDPLQGCRR